MSLTNDPIPNAWRWKNRVKFQESAKLSHGNSKKLSERSVVVQRSRAPASTGFDSGIRSKMG